MRTKRAFDVVAAIFGLILLCPVMLLAAVALKLESRGPFLERQTRVGKDGKLFDLIRFRTAEGREPKVHPQLDVFDASHEKVVGRSLAAMGIDRIPQLLNVLLGDISLVGPAAQSPETVATYTPGERRILAAQPGLTSPAALTVRSEKGGDTSDGADYVRTPLADRLRMDLEYHLARSFGGDLRILLVSTYAWTQRSRAVAAVRRHTPWFVIDCGVALVAYTAAYYLRFLDTPTPYAYAPLSRHAGTMVLFAVTYAALNYATRLDRRVWRYATAAEAMAVASRCVVSTLALLAFDVAVTNQGSRLLPISVVISGGFFTFGGFIAVRYRSRLATGSWSRRRLASRRPEWAMKTLIFGAGEAGQLLAWRLLHLSEGSGYSVVGFIDDDPRKQGRSIHGVPVLGTRQDLPGVAQAYSVELIAIAMTNIGGEDMRSILTLAQQTPAQIKIVPDVFDWMSGTHEPLREVQVEDLLGRKPATLDTQLARDAVAAKRVLVTGAAGSIGSALCRQISRLNPELLIALDANESDLFDLAIDLRAQTPDLDLRAIVGDVTLATRIDAIFEEHSPQVIFHVAAYKHVPLMEEFPGEAARVNVLGTWTVLSAARRHEASRFVLVSTDKAVNPSSIMGATKRIAEMLVSSDPPSAMPSGTLPVCAAVRFGNVLGSRGSVVPTFNRQIDAGGPVTVTDPAMTRYFMDVQEAASLIIQAAQLTTGQDILMLDMGDQIRVDDLARKMIRMRGLRPDVDIPITYVGRRPGEKLQEELSSRVEERTSTQNPLIYRLTRNSHPTAPQAEKMVASVEALVQAGNLAAVRELVLTLATGESDRTASRREREKVVAKEPPQPRVALIGRLEHASPPTGG